MFGISFTAYGIMGFADLPGLRNGDDAQIVSRYHAEFHCADNINYGERPFPCVEVMEVKRPGEFLAAQQPSGDAQLNQIEPSGL